jgi:hypothetical protein
MDSHRGAKAALFDWLGGCTEIGAGFATGAWTSAENIVPKGRRNAPRLREGVYFMMAGLVEALTDAARGTNAFTNARRRVRFSSHGRVSVASDARENGRGRASFAKAAAKLRVPLGTGVRMRAGVACCWGTAARVHAYAARLEKMIAHFLYPFID